MMKLVEMRKLVAVDMALHGRQFILAEFAVGVLLGIGLGLFFLRTFLSWLSLSSSPLIPQVLVALLGLWAFGTAVNYIPLFLYAVSIAKSGTFKAEGEPELPRKRRYNVQQFIIFVPFLVAIVAIAQERSQRRRQA
jgi:hypothetical protein